MERKFNLFDKIGSHIRGYNGYVVREEKRNTDKKLREQLSSKISNAESDIIEYQQQLLKNNNIQTCQEWELIRKSLNILLPKVQYAPYGESSFFSEKQLKENELDEIYRLDLEMAEKVDLLLKLVEQHIEDVLKSVIINRQIKAVEELIQIRTTFIKNFK